MTANVEQRFVQIVFENAQYPLIPLNSLPEDSELARLAKAKSDETVAVVNLNECFDFLDSMATRMVLSILYRDPYLRQQQQQLPPHLIKMQTLSAMQTVCDMFGLDFEAIVAPRFCTLEKLENCRFVANRVGARGAVVFSDNFVQINYRAENCVLFNGRYAYALQTDNCVQLFIEGGDIFLRLATDGTRLTLESLDGQLCETFVSEDQSGFCVCTTQAQLFFPGSNLSGMAVRVNP